MELWSICVFLPYLPQPWPLHRLRPIHDGRDPPIPSRPLQNPPVDDHGRALSRPMLPRRRRQSLRSGGHRAVHRLQKQHSRQRPRRPGAAHLNPQTQRPPPTHAGPPGGHPPRRSPLLLPQPHPKTPRRTSARRHSTRRRRRAPTSARTSPHSSSASARVRWTTSAPRRLAPLRTSTGRATTTIACRISMIGASRIRI